MTLTLTPELEQHVNDLVRQGAYPDAQAVLAERSDFLPPAVRRCRH